MNVLSLCDGMSCGQIALKELNIHIDKYFASEIKDIAIKVTKDNFPNTIHIGDLTKVSYDNGILHTEIGDFKTNIDFVIFGSPCQTFSIACKTDKRIGLEDDMKSGLFLHCYRILKEINPKFFFMENVASMKDDDRDFISELMGVKYYKINADKVAPALRNRYYWTNLSLINPINEININLNDILESGWSDRNKARSLLVSDSRPLTTPVKMFHRYYSTGFTTLIFKSEQQYTNDKRLKYMKDVWNISILNSQAKERNGYPTQKPKELIGRILKSSLPFDKETKVYSGIVLDCFAGSGTTLKVAQELKVNYVGCDNSPIAIEYINKRLNNIL